MTYPEIKTLFIQKGISSKKLAKQIGVSPVTLSIVLTGRQRSSRIQKAIAKALKVPYKILWGSVRPII